LRDRWRVGNDFRPPAAFHSHTHAAKIRFFHDPISNEWIGHDFFKTKFLQFDELHR
jgi:hypothetical protein